MTLTVSRQFGGKVDDVLCFGRLDIKPLFRLGFGRQAFVMGVNHGRGIARLRGSQVFVAVQGEVKRAIAVAQPVSFAGNLCVVA